ncbi:MAG: TrmH family RNA methyltransferase [Planctomycetota bacterium]
MAREQYKDTARPRRFARDLPSPVPPHPADALLTPERRQVFRQVLARRCRRLVVVVENCHDPHNATAVIRTCDCFGLHRVHVTTDRSRFKINRRVSQGSHRYVDLRVHNDITEACAELRSDGYRILVSDLSETAVIGPQRLTAMLAEQPLALVFGSEGFGVSEAASAGADGHFLIPMAGFAQSLNLSVSVATSVYALRSEALAADAPGDLDPAEQCFWYEAWVRAQRGAAAERLIAQAPDHLPPPDPRARLETDRRGEELESYGAP